ncbi:hypothetical protein Tco_1114154 [Tanacetum coccineum]|uniref:Uncharacterized protein n=1 Tax=Tanacetum coccineum TaxID=301880 RepID=A0ABQ5IVC6_9ASTR
MGDGFILFSLGKGLKGNRSEANSKAYNYVSSAIRLTKGSELSENALQNNRRVKRKSQAMDGDRSTKLIKDPLLVDQVAQFDDLLVNRVRQFDAIKAVKLVTPPVAGADLRAAFVASCFLGAFPPVDLRAEFKILGKDGGSEYGALDS